MIRCRNVLPGQTPWQSRSKTGTGKKSQRDNRTLAWALREVAVAIQDGAPGPGEDARPYTRQAWRLAARVVVAEAKRLEVEAKVNRGVKRQKTKLRIADRKIVVRGVTVRG